MTEGIIELTDGIINVYKEPGYTSFDVVAKLRGILKQKKIGHTGTLDPMAEGVLLVCLGKATKLVDMLTEGTKEYHAVMQLGLETDTEDITGHVLREHSLPADITKECIVDALSSFVGAYNQIPPMYSAIKKDGKKLYEYARQGISIEREPRAVEIYSIDNIEVELPDKVRFDVHCSKGTYIRSLCRDVGNVLGCGGVLAGLIRQEVHGYKIHDALRLSDIERLHHEGALTSYIIPIDEILSDYAPIHIREEYQGALRNGNKLGKRCFEKIPADAGSIIRVYHRDTFLALYEYQTSEQVYKPYKMFLDRGDKA